MSYLEQKKGVKILMCDTKKEGSLTFVVGPLKVDFVTNLRVFWWFDEFDASILALL